MAIRITKDSFLLYEKREDNEDDSRLDVGTMMVTKSGFLNKNVVLIDHIFYKLVPQKMI